jgi:hypothetical protein
MKSKCCNAEIKIVGGDEGTIFYQCLGCGKGCDLAWMKKGSGKLQIEAFHNGYDEGVKVTLTQLEKEVEKKKLLDPNPYGEWVRVKNVNKIIDDVIKLLRSKE